MDASLKAEMLQASPPWSRRLRLFYNIQVPLLNLVMQRILYRDCNEQFYRECYSQDAERNYPHFLKNLTSQNFL